MNEFVKARYVAAVQYGQKIICCQECAVAFLCY